MFTKSKKKTNLLIAKTNFKLSPDIYCLPCYNLSLLQHATTKVIWEVFSIYSFVCAFLRDETEIEQFSFEFKLKELFCEFVSALRSFQTVRHMEKIM